MNLRFASILLTGLTSVLTAVMVLGVCVFLLKLPVHVYDAGWLLLTVALSLMISIWMGYRFIQPVRRRLYEIEEMAALMAAGRLHYRVATLGTGDDEIEQLAVQFNQMANQIENQVRMLQALAEENQRLAGDAQRAAALDERQRLARELHDSVSQQLFAIAMLSAAAERHAAARSPALSGTLAQLQGLAEAAQREMRGLLLHLRPVELAGRALAEAARAFLDGIEERHQLQTSLQFEVNIELGPAIEEQLFRVLQEAVANVLKHAQATQVQVLLAVEDGNVVLTITDNGIGIDTTVEAGHDSYGLHSMQERTQAVGGHFEIWRRNQGTAVRVQVPIFPEEGQG